MPTDQIGTAESILSADDRSTRVRVDCPDWNCHVYVRQVSAGERDEFEATIARLREQKKPTKASARFAILVCCDDAGRPIFEPKHLGPLNEKNGALLTAIWKAGSKLNRWLEEAKDVADLEKNFDEADASDSC